MTHPNDVIAEEQTALTRAIVRDLLWLSLAWVLVRAVCIPILRPHPGAAFVLLTFRSLLLVAIPFLLWRAGRTRQSAWCLAVSASLLAAVYMLLSGGIRSSASVALVAVVVVAVAVLGRRGALLIGIPVAGYLAAITIFQASGGQLPELLPETHWVALLNILASGSMAFLPMPRALARLTRVAAERQQIATDLRTSGLRLQGLMDAVEGIVWECDAQTGHYTFVSLQAERLLGYPARNWLGDGDFWAEHIHPDDRGRARSSRDSALAGRCDTTVEYRMIAANGRFVCLRDRIGVTIEEGEAVGLRGLMVDITSLREAEAALRNREQRLAMTQSRAGLGVFERNLQTGVNTSNAEWLRMFGFTSDETQSHEDCFARVHPEDRARVDRDMRTAMAWNGVFDAEFRVVWPDGGTHWVMGKGELLCDATGVPTHFLCLCMDIAKRRQTETALAETGAFLRAIIDAAPSLIFVVDSAGRCILANRRAAGYYGASAEELTDDSGVAAWVQSADPGALDFMKGSDDVIRTGRPSCRLERQAAPDGTARWFHAIQVPVARPEDAVVALGIATDVTGLKRAEENLWEKENHLRALLDSGRECVALLSADGSFLELNPAGLAIMEADSPREVLGQNVCGLIDPDYRAKFQELNRNVFSGGTFRMSFGITGLKGTHRWLETQAGPLRDAGGNVVGALGVSRDITERRELETALRLARIRLLHAEAIAHLGSFSGDLIGGRTEFSAEVYRILGPEAPFFMDEWKTGAAKDASGCMLRGDDEAVHAAYRDLVTNGTAMDVTFRWRRPDHELRYVHLKGSRELDPAGNPVRIFGVVQDVTEHRQMLERLRQLTLHQEKVREEERTRIAREIHDELGQQLTGLKMRAAWTERLLSSSPGPLNGGGSVSQACAELSAMSEALESTIRTVRRIASELRPPVLDALGLIPALEWLRGNFERDHGIGCVTELQCGSVSRDAATTVFRVAQEALTNVARHSSATRVRIRLSQKDKSLILDIEDDGRGLDPGAFARQGSFGLIGMRERARLANGSVDFLAAETGGLLLRLSLPDAGAKYAGSR